MRETEFRPLIEFPWLLASSDGYLINSQTGNTIRGTVKKNGYVEVCIVYDDKLHYRLLHRLIAEAFCERKSNCDEVNHKDGNKKNNKAENLEWVSHADNLKHAFQMGLREDDVSPRSVKATNIFTGETMEFPSIYKAARFLDISQGNICMCCKGLRPYASGFFWSYAE